MSFTRSSHHRRRWNSGLPAARTDDRGGTIDCGDEPGRHQLPRRADAGAAAAGDVFDGLGGALALALHPERDVPPEGPGVSPHDRASACARTRPAEGRPQPAWLHDGFVDHRARERTARHRDGRQDGTGPGGLPVHGLRHTRREGCVGLAGRRPPPVAALHHHRRQGRRHLADVHGREPRGGARRAGEGQARAGPARGSRAGPGAWRSMPASGAAPCTRRWLPATS